MTIRATILAIILAIVGIGMPATSSAKDHKDLVSRTISPKGSFDKVCVSNGISVKYEVSTSATKVKIEGDPELVEAVEAKVRGGVLTISIINKGWNRFRKASVSSNKLRPVRVNGPALRQIEANSAASFEIVGRPMELGRNHLSVEANSGAKVSTEQGISCGSLSIECNSAASVDLEKLAVNGNLQIECNSAAKVDVSGHAANVRIEANSAATVDAAGLKSKTMAIEANSAATVKHSNRNARVNKSSAASVNFKERKK